MWNFGGPPGNFLGGGLPAQEAGASFASSGGGAINQFTNPSSGSGGLDLNSGIGEASGPAGERGIASIGDGGLQVMMARMRIRMAYHASELMSGRNLSSVANQQNSSAQQNTDAITNTSAN